jgi:hypothetical protein
MAQAAFHVPERDSIQETFEDYALTLQVVLVGCDGLVMASDRLFEDRRYVPRAFASAPARLTQRTFGSKILFSDAGDVACGFAGGPQAREIARRIVSDCHPAGLTVIQWEDRIGEAIQPIRGSGAHVMDEVFVLRADTPGSAVWVLVQDSLPSFLVIEDTLCTGDILASANFLPGHFRRSDMSISALTKLALLTLAYASKDNPSGVGGGADLLTLNQTAAFSLSRHSEDELDALRRQFDDHSLQFITG